MRRLLVLIIALTACGTTSAPVAHVSVSPSPPAASSSPSPTASPALSSVLGVFYDATAATLEMVDSNGKVVGSAATTAPHRYNQGLPWTSASMTRAYFLDPAGAVHYLASDGTTGIATQLQVPEGQEAGFSVSPDDRRIAVALLGYSSTSSFTGTRIYVQDLAGGGHHVEIYSSPVKAEFPIAWTKGRLVVALSTPLCCGPDLLNPYGASEYGVVDPATGNRLVLLCRGTGGPVGPPTAAGVTCGPGAGRPTYYDWDGAVCCSVGAAGYGPLAPDGEAAAWDAANGIEVGYGPDSPRGLAIYSIGVKGDVEAWLDTTHLVYRLQADSAQYIGLVPELVAAKVPGSDQATLYEGTFPAAVS